MENDKIADAFQGKKGYNDKNDTVLVSFRNKHVFTKGGYFCLCNPKVKMK